MAFRKLCAELNAANKWKIPATIAAGDLCLTLKNKQFHRIQIIGKKYDRILCHFIDVGNKTWLNINQIFHCKNQKLLTIEPQAICFTLEGVESYLDDYNYLKWMNYYLIGKLVWAKIATTQVEYTNQFGTLNETGIKAIMFNLSYEGEWRNVNEEILKKFCISQTLPTLMELQYNSVKVTCVADSGEIYCHNEESDYGINIIDTAIRQINKPQAIFQKPPSLIRLSFCRQIYLAMDTVDQQYYRITICADENGSDLSTHSMLKCFFIDYGYTKMLPFDLIFEANIFLQYYPPQAISFKLASTESSAPNYVSILRSIIKPKSKICVLIGNESNHLNRGQSNHAYNVLSIVKARS